MLRLNLPVLCLLLVPLLACPEPEPPLPGPDPAAGVDPAVPAAPGEARAGQVRAEDGEAALFGGIAAEGAAGDFKIYNEHVQFIIQGAYHSHGYVDTGGLVIDADLVRPEGTLHRDPFDDFFISHGIGWLFHADSVEVIDPGSSGVAHIRAQGGFEMWSFIHGAIEASQPFLAEAPVSITVDYRLAGGSQTLEIEATFSNESGEVARFNPSFGYLGSDEDLDPWASGLGLNPPSFDSADALGVVDRWGGATFSIWRASGPIDVMGLQDLTSQAGLSGTADGWTDLESGDSLVLHRNLTIASDPAAAEAIRRESLGEVLGSVAGRVTEVDSDTGIAGARVHFIQASGEEGGHPSVAGFARSDAEGNWNAQLPPGDWQVYVTGRGIGQLVDVPEGAGRYAPYANPRLNERQLAALSGAESPPAPAMARGYLTPSPSFITIDPSTAATLDLELEAAGRIQILAADDSGVAVPFYAEIRWAAGSGPSSETLEGLHDALGLADGGSLYLRIWCGDGDMSVPAPPGIYSVHVSHSWRHERADFEDVVVNSGSATQVVASLAVAVPPDGWQAMDSHLHAAPSNDGSLGMEDRLLACAATGVQIPVTTDHDRMADYRPLASALGLEDRMTVLPGVEVSSVVRGHFNLFPVEPQPQELLNGGAPAWWNLPETTDELMDIIRDAGMEDSMVQVNHGRVGMFDFSNYLPSSGIATAATFSWNFDLFELMNSSNVAAREALRLDYYSFLNQGLMKVPTGVSDSHSRTSPCGLARTDVYLGGDSPSDVSGASLREALLAGHVVVSSGPTLRVTSGESIPGDVLEGASHSFSVEVSGPSYIQPEEVRLVRNGVTLQTATVEPSLYDGRVWLATEFVIEETEDAWYVVEVEGYSPMGHVWRGATPYAITGAFLVDVAGDGWEAPGL